MRIFLYFSGLILFIAGVLSGISRIFTDVTQMWGLSLEGAIIMACAGLVVLGISGLLKALEALLEYGEHWSGEQSSFMDTSPSHTPLSGFMARSSSSSSGQSFSDKVPEPLSPLPSHSSSAMRGAPALDEDGALQKIPPRGLLRKSGPAWDMPSKSKTEGTPQANFSWGQQETARGEDIKGADPSRKSKLHFFPQPQQQPSEEEPSASSLFVVREGRIAGRSARVLSDGTVEAETPQT